ncbi:MAG: uracil-DNA glycosylase [Chitinophagia bacterium]|nr:uracil-DNA glycosylase [Chitinophagia bacterium]
MDVKIQPEWKAALAEEFTKPYFAQLVAFLKEEKQAGKQVFPPGNQIFNAFLYTPLSELKVVVLGQDPYHGTGQAHGLSFSVPDGVPPPPSLVNIYKEIADDIGIVNPNTGNLIPWARQGVLLLNASLTVLAHQPMSHKNIGWQIFTDAVIKVIAEQKQDVVFLLWGRFAQEKAQYVNPERHLLLKAAHPSPLSAYNGFFGCKHFSKTNDWLIAKGKTPINWQL